MRCPNCGKTMDLWGESGEVAVCRRCGTVKDSEAAQKPELVSMVIEFAQYLTDDHRDLIEHFERLGIRAAITTIGRG